ncbi:PH domain-containing protein [Cyclobacterium plantarum]|uniref:PH domain-containing protein n=1 Tax=Cyclobacterium plantarum TaxID=2716263 RepID=A0ABX0HBV0_9BACT|nr:PH domain-containing protein [Cyclobacterium plantarum]NHE57828.1 PH domain-containing protein [Cyclobacterium plantarum]
MGIFNSILGNAGAVNKESLQRDFGRILTAEEQIETGFKLFRDTFIFTNKRLVLVDKQGLTGRKSEYLSLPYKSISRFSIETSGTFDLDAELKIWISSDPQPAVSKKFNKSVDVYEVQKLLAGFVLG